MLNNKDIHNGFDTTTLPAIESKFAKLDSIIAERDLEPSAAFSHFKNTIKKLLVGEAQLKEMIDGQVMCLAEKTRLVLERMGMVFSNLRNFLKRGELEKEVLLQWANSRMGIPNNYEEANKKLEEFDKRNSMQYWEGQNVTIQEVKEELILLKRQLEDFEYRTQVVMKASIRSIRVFFFLSRLTRAVAFLVSIYLSHYVAPVFKELFKVPELAAEIITAIIFIFSVDRLLDKVKAKVFWNRAQDTLSIYKVTYTEFRNLSETIKSQVIKSSGLEMPST